MRGGAPSRCGYPRAMKLELAAFAATFLLGACAAASADSSAPVDPVPSAEVAAPTSAPVASATPTSQPTEEPTTPAPTSTAAELPPYPDAAIQSAASFVQRSCSNLVYKNGCEKTRTGRVSLRVSLREDGSVLSVHRSSNDIETDPKVVEDCVLDAAQKVQFDAPKGTATSFTLKVVFGDKC